jgi:hypothetical protein
VHIQKGKNYLQYCFATEWKMILGKSNYKNLGVSSWPVKLSERGYHPETSTEDGPFSWLPSNWNLE